MKLFRNNRDTSIQKNRVPKYLLYALGEIILIVAGVFIAVQLNNFNEQKKDDKRTKKLLKQVQTDLRANIFYADFYLPFYKLQDSLAAQIINDKLTEQDYRNRPNIIDEVFLDLIYPIDNNTFKLLTEHLEQPPEELGLTLSYLYYIYNVMYPTKLKSADIIRAFHIEKQHDLYKNKPWAYKALQDTLPDEYYQYLANDPYFKNEVAEMLGLSVGQDYKAMKIIKNTSILAYEAIENILEKEKLGDTSFSYYKKESFKKVIGEYVNIEDSTDIAYISFEYNSLIYKDASTVKTKFYPANDTLFRTEDNHYFYTFKKKQDSIYTGFRKQSGLEMIQFIKRQ